MMKPDFELFLHSLQEGNYYEAHEALEAYWFPKRFEDDNAVLLLKGLINAAVSFELIKRGRFQQSKKVWRNYLKYRQLLYKINSPYLQQFHTAVRYVDQHRRDLEMGLKKLT